MSFINLPSAASHRPTLRTLLTQFLCDQDGQDVIEYGLLSSLIAVMGILIWNNIGVGIANAYGSWDQNVQDLWVPEDPIGGGS